jgi:glutathione-specific gamma-glutamylcyclotransferase
MGWIFGYGSLIWRPGFAFAERRAACVRGFARRLWQGSPDHRGVPKAPGRVATLVPDAAALCWGVAYRVEEPAREAILAALDARESGGFERADVAVGFEAGAAGVEPALTYIAPAHNPNYLGPAPLSLMAAQVRCAQGRSGTNAAYVLDLARALRGLGVEDAHVGALAALLGVEP